MPSPSLLSLRLPGEVILARGGTEGSVIPRLAGSSVIGGGRKGGGCGRNAVTQ